MMKLIYNAKRTRLEIKDGRSVYAHFAAASLSAASIEGILAAFEGTEPTEQAVEDAIAAASAKRGSVIPNEYRYAYGADQSCGDDVAKVLTAAVTVPEGKGTKVDLDAARAVAVANDVEDRFDVWMTKGLNPGMVRMNLGNVLRGMQRRGEPVTIGERTFIAAE